MRREVKNKQNAGSLSLRPSMWPNLSTMMICHQVFFLRFYNFSNISKPENGRTKQNRSGSSHLNYRARTIAILGCGGINEFHHFCCWHDSYYMDLLAKNHTI